MSEVVDLMLNTYKSMHALSAEQVADSRHKITRYYSNPLVCWPAMMSS
jgi:hypothetical protein